MGVFGFASANAEYLLLTGSEAVVFRKQGSPLILEADRKVTAWLLIRPILRAYDNISGNAPGTVLPLSYKIDSIVNETDKLDAGKIADQYGTGTIYIAAWGGRHPYRKTFEETDALQVRYRMRIIQIVTRDGDTYLDYLHELDGTPFLMGPGLVAGRHQTDERQGSDCAAFATYGMRRMGYDVSYGGPTGIVEYLEPLSAGLLRPDAGGVYVDADGRRFPISRVHPGDILHFGQQVSIFLRDEGVPDVLDVDDVVFESWGDSPRQTTIRKSDFMRMPLRIYRWKTDVRRLNAG